MSNSFEKRGQVKKQIGGPVGKASLSFRVNPYAERRICPDGGNDWFRARQEVHLIVRADARPSGRI